MNPRTQQILEAVIREFIETGEPVSSRMLARKYDWKIKDATVRNELHALTEGNYLEQLHTSAGRIPTDKGYQFLVERIPDINGRRNVSGRAVSDLSDEFLKGRFADFVGDLAEELTVLGVGYAPLGKEVYKSGLDDLFDRLAEDHLFTDMREACRIVEDFERLDERMGSLMGFVEENRPRVFIGKSPITRSRDLSVIAETFQIDGEDFLLAAVGPKRMDYERGLRLFMALRESIEQ